MAEDLELVSLFRGSIGKVLNFLLTCEEENSKSDIARGADVTFKTVSDIWPFLERHEIIIHTRTIGMAKMYSLNKDNRIVGQLRKIKHEINNHNHNNKGLGEIFSVYGFLLLLTLPLLGTIYFASNESVVDVSNESLINITTIVLNETNASNITEILVNGTIESITLPVEENASEAILNITAPEPVNVTQEPAVIETMVEEIVYRHESIEIGQRVQWYRQIKTHGGDNYTVGLNLPSDYSDLAMIDSLGNYTIDNGTLTLSGEHDIQMSFTTSPVTVSEQVLSESPYGKKVTISSESTLHYMNIAVSVPVPEGLNITIVEMPDKEITQDPFYNVTFLDSDGNGLYDTLFWTVPQLSTKEYLIQEVTPKKEEMASITFDRGLDCHKCGQHKAPPTTDVTMTITAAFSGNRTDSYLTDYFPAEWFVTNPNGGTVEGYNSSHGKISWHYDSVTDSVSKWYIVYSPQRTLPPTNYYFVSELAGMQSEPWRVIVADPPEEIFADFFTDGTLNKWVVSGLWVPLADTSLNASDFYNAYYNNGGGVQYFMNRSQSTVGYTTIKVSFRVATSANDAGENFTFYFYNGSIWTKMFSQQAITATTYTFDMPSNCSNNSNFRVSFSCINNQALEKCWLDDVRIIGTTIPGTILNVTIGNVSDIYRGDIDNDIFCNATSTGGSVLANVSLQYNNGSTGGWINLNETNEANNVSYIATHGTNPQWGVTVTTTGTIVPFDIYGNRTGSGNQFRCNTTTGAIGTPAKTNISSNGTMTVQTPNLQLNLTNTSTATVYADDGNDFNITCNVSTKLGNASSVGVYFQWNTSASTTWNNFTTTNTLALYANDTSPDLWTDVDNVSDPSMTTYEIYGHTAGSYWFRCYSNSSVYDGSFTNTTSAYPLTVQTPPKFRVSSVTIGNVSNITRGATETDVFCNVTLGGSGTGVTGFLSLQYYNITAWYDLNTTTTYLPKNLTYDNTYGGNPRNFSAITATTAYRFAVFGNWTGLNYRLRCNVTDQTNLAYNISLNGTMNVTAVPLNSNATTDIDPPITIYSDQSNNFNLTCNVSAYDGNATAVTVFAQWNTSASVTWNNFTKSGSLRANDTNFTFSNVDTGPPDTLVYRINATAAGSYWVRCFNNASRQDGLTTNTSNAIAIIVQAPSNLLNVTIGNVSNTYRGDTDDDIFCNATSTGGSLEANVTLQFQNATGWYTLNKSFYGGRVAYDDSLGTNPRLGETITTTGTIVKFAVFANWTGDQVLRCNVTTGAIGAPTTTNVSTTSAMTILAPILNTSIATVPASPILYNDESNNFNLTCNVSTLVGNASSVSIWAQYNTTVGVWYNMTGSTSLKANESSPIVFSNVDNSTPNTRVFRINSSTIGSYSVRCYANSSGNDGSNENWTNIVVVNVVSASSLANVTIGNVSDIYRGDTDDDIFCNASSSGASLTANVSLQYNNGTIGGWIYLNETNKVVNVSYIPTYGTNPRWNFLVTTAGNATRFAVYGNWTGSGNQFRCNMTTGPLSSPTGGNLSTNDAFMTIQTPPLNTSIQTVPSASIILYTDESNNLNMTCNVSTVIGNASSATVYAQWNSTVGVWNPLNSTSGPMRANESSPIVFSNVDNVTPDTRVFRVTSSVPGLYSVRCFANSSSQDGNNQNWTGIIAVNVSVPVSAISPEETIVDRDSVNASTPDYIMLNASTNYTIADALNITFKANLTSPTIGGQTNLVLGTNATNALGYAVLYWNPNVSFYAGNYTWWGEANASYVVNGTRTVLVYGGFNLTFQHLTEYPNASYVIGDLVKINATVKSLGPESPLQLNNSYRTQVNSTIIKEDSSTADVYLNYSEATAGNWTGNYSIKDNDPLSGNSYNVSLNATANYFFMNTTNFTRSFWVYTNITVSVTLYQAPIQYGSLNPGVTENASTVGGFPLIARIDNMTNVNVDLWIASNMSNMTGPGASYIMIGNMSFANESTGEYKKNLSMSYQLLKDNITVDMNGLGKNISVYWWIAVPVVEPGIYTTTVIVYTNRTNE